MRSITGGHVKAKNPSWVPPGERHTPSTWPEPASMFHLFCHHPFWPQPALACSCFPIYKFLDLSLKVAAPGSSWICVFPNPVWVLVLPPFLWVFCGNTCCLVIVLKGSHPWTHITRLAPASDMGDSYEVRRQSWLKTRESHFSFCILHQLSLWGAGEHKAEKKSWICLNWKS